MQYNRGLFIFRRDLRAFDNTGLIEAGKQCKEVLACFVLDSRQTSSHDYFSEKAFGFMLQSLLELHKELEDRGGKLYIFEGVAENFVQNIESIDAVFVNKDYTPFSRSRDKQIKSVCETRKIAFHSHADSLLNEPEDIVNGAGQPFKVFTPFYKHCIQRSVPEPIAFSGRFFEGSIPNDLGIEHLSALLKNFTLSSITGGRISALKILEQIKTHKEYKQQRDFPAMDKTTHLSAHHKFGTISIRESYHAMVSVLGIDHELVRQLYWRDFFTHIATHYPHVFGKAFQEKYDAVAWDNDEEKFAAWCEGKTGFPIVDAGMRELNKTGYMHNRTRMIVASFLTKDLHIDWRWGEKYFAQKLVDYDPCVNNGSWQWAASTGCDAQPYFRIFNPWLQQKRFDLDCVYIKKWLPELTEVMPAAIHKLDTHRPLTLADNYPSPIVDHKTESAEAKLRFKFA